MDTVPVGFTTKFRNGLFVRLSVLSSELRQLEAVSAVRRSSSTRRSDSWRQAGARGGEAWQWYATIPDCKSRFAHKMISQVIQKHEMSGQDWDTVTFTKKTKAGAPHAPCGGRQSLMLFVQALPISELQSRLA